MITVMEPGYGYHVTGDNPRLVEADLNKAVELVQRQAMKDGRHGILVTRYSPTSFSVVVKADVPYGVTHESCHMGIVRP